MPTLYIIATPIGNMEDITCRALRILGEVGGLACEDTRRTRRVYERYSIDMPSKVFSYHEHNEDRAGARILDVLNQGENVALCSNAGYPGISDPGYRIIRSVIESEHNLEVIPGANAVELALLYSGLPTSSYTFKGFPPRKRGALVRFLEMEKDSPHTLIFYESPYRVGKFLSCALETLGNRHAAVCIEMTKKFERIKRGPLSQLHTEFDGVTVKGEVTIVVAGNNPKFINKPVE
ncbi:MAG: 16S rRNA (cytidine(1402)-2'-O)-methyltransferase [Chitinivibrionales bacterium]|nr:16S rRNA (cytidine(1402)-2'-O)-methyltransferase [Chitinivibrionales bacterium]